MENTHKHPRVRLHQQFHLEITNNLSIQNSIYSKILTNEDMGPIEDFKKKKRTYVFNKKLNVQGDFRSTKPEECS